MPEEMTVEPVESHQESQSESSDQTLPMVGDTSVEQVQENSIQCSRDILRQGKSISTEDDKADYSKLDS
jgi:predicted transcriptional regulator